MSEVHQRAAETRALRPQANAANGVEAQPNNTAPLLRDEKSRRDWIEHELDMCCQVCPSRLEQPLLCLLDGQRRLKKGSGMRPTQAHELQAFAILVLPYDGDNVPVVS